VLLLTYEGFETSMAARGWSLASASHDASSKSPDPLLAVFSLTDLGSPDVASVEPDVLHVVGHFSETPSGVRLGPQERRSYAQQSAQQSNAGLFAETVSPELLAKRFPNLALCIVQESPTLRAERSLTDQDQVAYLRQFAAELARAGVPTVVSVPAVPEELGTEVTSAFDRAVDAWREGASGGIGEAVARAQQAVLEGRWTDPEQMLEAAFDVCLYDADPAGGAD
jgi:hypothetical protein